MVGKLLCFFFFLLWVWQTHSRSFVYISSPNTHDALFSNPCFPDEETEAGRVRITLPASFSFLGQVTPLPCASVSSPSLGLMLWLHWVLEGIRDTGCVKGQSLRGHGCQKCDDCLTCVCLETSHSWFVQGREPGLGCLDLDSPGGGEKN